MKHVFKWIRSPVGLLKLIGSEAGLIAILWENDRPQRVRLGALAENPEDSLLCRTEQQLAEYFKGDRMAFDVKLAFVGTPFQNTVWQALLTIPYGETRSYSQIARQIGNPTAVRAVGAANGRNPISIITPCHRVIGSSGTLTGFAGGLDTKRYLLNLEAQRETRKVGDPQGYTRDLTFHPPAIHT